MIAALLFIIQMGFFGESTYLTKVNYWRDTEVMTNKTIQPPPEPPVDEKGNPQEQPDENYGSP